MRIVDRASGAVLLEFPETQGDKLTELVEDVQSFQISGLFLDAAGRVGLAAEHVSTLSACLHGRPTLYGGLQAQPEANVHRLGGQLLDHTGNPLGGLVVTVQNSAEEAVSWAYSGPDGRFQLHFEESPNWSESELLVSGRGGLLLCSFELDELTDEVEQLEPFTILTVTGRVRTESGTSLEGGRVEAWSTWAPLDSSGDFRLPVDRLNEELVLEVFAATGQPLGGYWKVRLPETEPASVGEHTVPEPSPVWPDSETPLMARPHNVQPIFTGAAEA